MKQAIRIARGDAEIMLDELANAARILQGVCDELARDGLKPPPDCVSAKQSVLAVAMSIGGMLEDYDEVQR